MIEIWNIDTFEGANVSKTKLISQIANEFQTENKGVYFMVRNVTESECANLIASGQLPDIFSCSYGVAESVKKSPFAENFIPSSAEPKFLLFIALATFATALLNSKFLTITFILYIPLIIY